MNEQQLEKGKALYSLITKLTDQKKIYEALHKGCYSRIMFFHIHGREINANSSFLEIDSGRLCISEDKHNEIMEMIRILLLNAINDRLEQAEKEFSKL